jgi:hypothetical protein
MSRSYHVTERQARLAFRQGDVEPTYQASEKAWVKKQQTRARKTGVGATTNRAIVAGEKARTHRARTRVEARENGAKQAGE